MRQSNYETFGSGTQIWATDKSDLKPSLKSSQYPRVLISLANKQKQCDFVFFISLHQNQLHLVPTQSAFQIKTGEEYHLTIVLPNSFQYQTKAKVSYHTNSNQGFGLLLTRISRRFRKELGHTLFRYGPRYSPRYICNLGLTLGSVKDQVEYQVVEQASEYREILALRQEAYHKAGKLSPDQSWQAMADEFDNRSMILVAKHHEKIVASMRLILNPKDSFGEHEKFVHFPSTMPAREDIIEITRVCTAPDYRGCDLLQGLFQYASKIALTLDRSWILGSSTPALLKLYQRIGFRPTKLEYIHRELNQRPHVIFLAKKSDILYGRSVSPLHWHIMYREIYQFAKACQLTADQNLTDRLRLVSYSALGVLYEIGRSLGCWLKKIKDF